MSKTELKPIASSCGIQRLVLICCWDRGGIVVVHQTPNREVLSSIRTGDIVLCP